MADGLSASVGAIEPAQGRTIPEVVGWVRSVVRLPTLRGRALPRGDGARVLVVPGFMTSDRSTVVLRRFLRRLGYDVHGWGMGINRGRVEALMPEVIARAEGLADGGSLKLVGWSLGGVIARELSRERPALVERIVTMGTPVVGGPKYTFTARHYQKRGVDLDAIEARIAERNAQPLPAPVTAIYSRADQVVSWRACLDPNTDNDVEHVEVATSHIGLGFDPETLRIVARALADEQP